MYKLFSVQFFHSYLLGRLVFNPWLCHTTASKTGT